MRIVIKFAGALLEDSRDPCSLSRHVADARPRMATKSWWSMAAAACSPQPSSAWASKANLSPACASPIGETRDAAVMVFAGLLNKRLAAAISAEGQPAIGISAADAACFSAAPLVHNDVEGSLGFVGYLTSVNVVFSNRSGAKNSLPVAPCLGLGADGELYNINADHMAAACAEFIDADHLIYLTDVAGVLDGEKVLSAISCEEIDHLVQSRVVSGGMILKLEAAKRALEGGVREVHIVGGDSAAAALAPHLFSPVSGRTTFSAVPGTRVLRSFSSAEHSAAALSENL